MDRRIIKTWVKNGLLIGMLVMVSCAHLKQNDFTKRKYLNLKNNNQKENGVVVDQQSGEEKLGVRSHSGDSENSAKVKVEKDTTCPETMANDGQGDIDPIELTLADAIEKGYVIYFEDEGTWYRLDSARVSNSRLLGIKVEVNPNEVSENLPNMQLQLDNWYIRDAETNSIAIVTEDISQVKSAPFIYPDESIVEAKLPEADEVEPTGRNREFEQLTPEQKTKALDDFNYMFNIGLVMFILSALFFVFAGVVSSYFLAPAIVLIVIVWILSFFARSKVRHIDESKQSAYFRFQLGAAWIISVIGTLVAIVTLVGGVVLLILRLMKKI